MQNVVPIIRTIYVICAHPKIGQTMVIDHTMRLVTDQGVSIECFKGSNDESMKSMRPVDELNR